MNQKDWIILEKVYEEKNITKAAEHLYISQPTLTYRLQQIEKEFNIKLFFRGRRGVDFTEQGELLVHYAKDMIRQRRDMEEFLWNKGNEVRGTLRLSVSRTYAFYELPQILKEFHEKFPQVDFHIDTGVNADVVQSVYRQDAHIGIVRGEQHAPDEDITISEETISILSIHEVDVQNLPSMRRISYQTDPALDLVIDKWWKDNFSKPPVSNMKVDNVEIAKRMVLSGLGYCIAPSIALEKNKHLEKGILTDGSGSPIIWRTRLLYREELLELSMVKKFVEFIRNRYVTEHGK